MRCLRTLDDIVEVLKEEPEQHLFVRWTPDVGLDLRNGTSRDELTGVELPGLSANSLAVEPWWGQRSLRTWVARRLYDYGHLRELRGPGTRPCIFVGTECGRGPDNEPLICDCHVVAEIDARVIEEANRVIGELPADWGSLRRF
jgi:hypothetical protein